MPWTFFIYLFQSPILPPKSKYIKVFHLWSKYEQLFGLVVRDVLIKSSAIVDWPERLEKVLILPVYCYIAFKFLSHLDAKVDYDQLMAQFLF